MGREHDWKLEGSGDSLCYRCSQCGTTEHIFRETVRGETSSGLIPEDALDDCDEELVRQVLES